MWCKRRHVAIVTIYAFLHVLEQMQEGKMLLLMPRKKHDQIGNIKQEEEMCTMTSWSNGLVNLWEWKRFTSHSSPQNLWALTLLLPLCSWSPHLHIVPWNSITFCIHNLFESKSVVLISNWNFIRKTFLAIKYMQRCYCVIILYLAVSSFMFSEAINQIKCFSNQRLWWTQSHIRKYYEIASFFLNYQKCVLDQVAEGKAGLPSPWSILAIALGVNFACALLWRKT